MKRTWPTTLATFFLASALGFNSLPGVWAQSNPKPFDPAQQKTQEWTNLPEIIPFANPDGSLDIAWRDHSSPTPKIYLTKFAKTGEGYNRISAEELPSLGVLAGFTKDTKGNAYHLTAEPGKGEEPKRIILYKNKQKFWDFKKQDGDQPGELPKLPLDNGTSQIVTGAGKLFLDINLLPSHAYNVILDLENPAVNAARCARETLWHHNVDQRVLFDGQDFLAIENRDHEVTLSLMKFSPTEKYPFEPYAERLRSVFTRTNNGNSIFTELGDIEPGVGDGNGYLVLFASERDWNDQMEGLNKPGEQTGLGGQLQPRDLAVVHVRKDFDKQEINWKATPEEKKIDGNEISQAPKLVDTTGVVNSIGTGKTVTYHAKNDGWDWPNYNAETAKMIESGVLAERAYKTGGVNWLTGYGASYETSKSLPATGKSFPTVVHPKLVRLAANSYIAIWEEHSATRATWDKRMCDRTYQTTKAMTITLADEGGKVRIKGGTPKDLGKVRVMAFDDAFNLGGKAAWVTGSEATKSLKLNLLDAGLTHQVLDLPLIGDAKSSNSQPSRPDPKPETAAQSAPPTTSKPDAKPDAKPAATGLFQEFSVEQVGVKFSQDWTNSRDDKARLVTSVSPDNSVRLFLKGTKQTSYDPVQEKMAELLAGLLPGLRALEEGDTQHDIAKGGLGLRMVTYTAQLNGKPVTITVEFAKDTSQDAELTVLLIRCVDDGVKKHDATIAKISQSLRHIGGK
ncbi:MAG: hypothetical protein K1Y36_25985 [Blastocatellia bacterium]|nr:hypothetical protein [Blastocatellia bacterium]